MAGEYYLSRGDGKLIIFAAEGGAYVADTPSYGELLVGVDGFSYQDAMYIYNFDASGALVSVEDIYNLAFLINVDSEKAVINQGGEIIAQVNFGGESRVESVSYDSRDFSFSYQENGMLSQVVADELQVARFVYELSNLTEYYAADDQLITKWTYDSEWRAVSSEHANGQGKVVLVYNEDGTVTETNSLGRVTKYTFQDFDGLKRLVAVEGEQSANCQASHKSYSYFSNGMLQSKTDWEGNLTNYEYDDRGLEIKRIEAAGTAFAREVTSEWHSSFRVPVKISTSKEITEFEYDANGRLLARKVTPLGGSE
ncbi:hypothetical protein Mag101_06620 [Microbulbifer agarilyticus]|uniref:Sugar-binding protein n=1 Tax=Microbulbifer agarilyticus TaxID=260552 RepID=A0A1Q2M3P0_9GAMM|nr:hypothetical protein Mag101_06620 [Microbulbifer agarilyticus]